MRYFPIARFVISMSNWQKTESKKLICFCDIDSPSMVNISIPIFEGLFNSNDIFKDV